MKKMLARGHVEHCNGAVGSWKRETFSATKNKKKHSVALSPQTNYAD
jgi:hypothetical protein